MADGSGGTRVTGKSSVVSGSYEPGFVGEDDGLDAVVEVELGEQAAGGGLKFIDNAPKARHQFDFSPGDIVIVSRDLFARNGRRVGSLRLACIATDATTQQCNGTEALTGGTLELAGASVPKPRTAVAVIGGTGAYSGARGTSVSTDRKTNADVADQIITILP
jgi:hypothetical protein